MDAAEITIAFASCIVGGLAGPILDRRLPRSPADSTFNGVNTGDRAFSDNSIRVNTNVQQIFYIGAKEVDSIKLDVDRAVRSSPRANSIADLFERYPQYFFLGPIVCLLVAGAIFQRYRHGISLTLLILAFFTIGFAISSFIWTAFVRRISFGGLHWFLLLVLVAGGVTTVIDAILIRHPTFLPTVAATSDGTGSRTEIPRTIGFGSYEAIGVFVTTMLVGSVLLSAVKYVALANAVTSRESTSRWRTLSVRGGGPSQWAMSVIPFLVISLFITSGAVYQLGTSHTNHQPYGPHNVPNLVLTSASPSPS